MKVGCSSCVTVFVGLALGALVVGGTIGATLRMLQQPGSTPTVVTTVADGVRAQQKLFDLSRRRLGAPPVTLTEAEVNALLSRHLVEARGVRLGTPSARLMQDERIELTASLPLDRILEEVATPGLASVLPRPWREHPIWFRVGARVRVDDRPPRQLRLDVSDLLVGRQRLPTPMLRLLVDPRIVGLLRWPLPSHIESVTIEPGRAVIRIAS